MSFLARRWLLWLWLAVAASGVPCELVRRSVDSNLTSTRARVTLEPSSCGHRVRERVVGVVKGISKVYLGADDLNFAGSEPLRRCLPNATEAAILERRRHASCAIVGASDNNRGSKLGKIIDSHEAVFRAGAACTLRMATDVGAKTTYCVSFWRRRAQALKKAASSSLSEKKKEEDDLKIKAPALVVPLKSWRWLKRENLARDCLRHPHLRWRFTHPDWILKTHRDLLQSFERFLPDLAKRFRDHLQKSHFTSPTCPPPLLAEEGNEEEDECPSIADFSSGFEAVLFALRVCHSPPRVYGFDLSTAGNASYTHMRGGEKIGEKDCSVVSDHRHPFILERELMLAWNASGLIALVDMPRPPPVPSFLNQSTFMRSKYNASQIKAFIARRWSGRTIFNSRPKNTQTFFWNASSGRYFMNSTAWAKLRGNNNNTTKPPALSFQRFRKNLPPSKKRNFTKHYPTPLDATNWMQRLSPALKKQLDDYDNNGQGESTFVLRR